MEQYDVVVVGLGPAGMTAAIFTTRYGLKTVVLGDGLGSAADAFRIENIPGIKSISGAEFGNALMEQVKRLGAKVEFAKVKEVKKKAKEFGVLTDFGNFEAKTVVFATGTKQRKLGIPGEEKFIGKGVSYCAICDAALFKGKTVCVVGGGDAAVTTALLVGNFSDKAYLVHRRDRLRAEPVLVKQLESGGKIEVVYNSTVEEILGKEMVEKIKVKKDREVKEVAVQGVFIQIGSDPATELAEKLGVKLDVSRHIIVDSEQRTNIPGVFAAGDCTTGSNKWEQIVVAQAEGSIAANSAYNYLKAR